MTSIISSHFKPAINHIKPRFDSEQSAFKPRFSIPGPQSAFIPIKPNLGKLKKKHREAKIDSQNQISCYKIIQPPCPPPGLMKPKSFRATYYKVQREGTRILWVQIGDVNRKITFSDDVHLDEALCIQTRRKPDIIYIYFRDGTVKQVPLIAKNNEVPQSVNYWL